MAEKEIFLRDLKSVTFAVDETIEPDLRYSEDSSETSNIKNWLRYRICPPRICNDCDIDERVFRMYEHLFDRDEPQEGDEERLFRLKNEMIILETDTMNSFATIFNQFIREHCNKGQSKFDTYKDRDRYFLNNIDDWYAESQNIKLECLKEFNKFAAYTHCLANMILVPKGYNVARYNRTKDYWDLTLIDLKENRRLNVEIYKVRFFLMEWFDTDGSVKKLHEKHPSYEEKGLKVEDYLKVVTEINCRIEARAKALAECGKLDGFEF
ncbi:MAG TPA: hypothetical protein DDX72_10895 [Ruminococcaceae bacterium]|nr:hypothetical protein [Oscillospiraceae bacterium]